MISYQFKLNLLFGDLLPLPSRADLRFLIGGDVSDVVRTSFLRGDDFCFFFGGFLISSSSLSMIRTAELLVCVQS